MTTSPKSDAIRYHATAEAVKAVPSLDMDAAVGRHVAGDWGHASAALRKQNDHARSHGGRLLSVHRTSTGVTFLVTSDATTGVPLVTMPKKQ